MVIYTQVHSVYGYPTVDCYSCHIQESNTVRGIVYADLDFGRRAHGQPIKPPPAFEKVQYADVP